MAVNDVAIQYYRSILKTTNFHHNNFPSINTFNCILMT